MILERPFNYVESCNLGRLLSSEKCLFITLSVFTKIAIFISKMSQEGPIGCSGDPVGPSGLIFEMKIAIFVKMLKVMNKPFWELNNLPKLQLLTYLNGRQSITTFEKSRFFDFLRSIWSGASPDQVSLFHIIDKLEQIPS